NGVLNFYTQQADGTGKPEPITSNRLPRWPSSAMPDGQRVFGFELGPTRAPEVVVVHLDRTVHGDASRIEHDDSRAEENLFRGTFPEISPDGRYLAYQSDEAGRSQVYLRPFPTVHTGPWQISTAGGT